MIRRRSFTIKKRSQKRRSQKRRSNHRFGKIDKNLFGPMADFIKPKKLSELLIYIKNIVTGVLTSIKPDESIKLTWIEKIQRFVINLYKNRINKFVENLNPVQAVLLSDGKYSKELKQNLLFNTPTPSLVDDTNKISGIKEKAKLFFLNSIFGRTTLRSIKEFIKLLTPNQLILLINGKFNLTNALYNTFLHTKYPTNIKGLDPIIAELKNEP